MRILLTTISLDPERGGGGTERTRWLARHLASAGQQVAVVSIQDGAVAGELRRQGIGTYVSGSIRIRYPIPLLAPLRLWRLVRRSEAIHILGYWNLLSVATALLARLARRPYVFCAAGEFAELSSPRPMSRLFHRTVGKPMVEGAAKIVAITELERQEILARFGRSPDDVVTLPNGVGERPPDPADERNLLPDGPFVLFMGRLAPVKGPDILLAAFERCAARFPGLGLVLAGPDFGLGARLAKAAASPALQGRVHFVGFLDEHTRSEAYRRAAFLVVPSRSEAMSLVAIEAGVAGLPVVVTDRCGLGVVEEVGAGAVCEATPEGVAEALVRLLEAPDRAAMGERWRAFVAANYRWDATAARLMQVFRSTAG